MKRFVCLLALTALLLSACSAPTTPAVPEKAYTKGIYQLTFQAKLLSSSGVGNDWIFTYTHNGKPVKNGYEIVQDLGIFTFQSIDVEIREKDKLDDVGTGTLIFGLCDGGSGKTQVTVANTGSAAIWDISCRVKLAKRQ